MPTSKNTELTKPDLRIIKKITKQQRKFIENWLDPARETFGNAYQSALKAGYSEYTSRVITGNAKDLQWIRDAKELYASLEPEHIYLAMQRVALDSPYDRDKLRALELMAKIRGMFIDRTESRVSVNFTNSVPRPIIEIRPEPQDETAEEKE